jgi:hypothetical protein
MSRVLTIKLKPANGLEGGKSLAHPLVLSKRIERRSVQSQPCRFAATSFEQNRYVYSKRHNATCKMKRCSKDENLLRIRELRKRTRVQLSMSAVLREIHDAKLSKTARCTEKTVRQSKLWQRCSRFVILIGQTVHALHILKVRAQRLCGCAKDSTLTENCAIAHRV